MMKIYSILVFLSILIYSPTVWAQLEFNQQRAQQIDSVIHRNMQAQHITGATALIIKNGTVVYSKAFGYADTETRKPMTINSIFRIASQTKPVTSLAVMMLWEKGKFLLDDPVSRYIPAFKNPRVVATFNPADSSYTTQAANREITVRDLLRHTSGIDYAAIFGNATMRAIYAKAGVFSGVGTTTSDLATQINLLAQQPLRHQPGAAFSYGQNIDVLGRLVEIWSGQPLDVFMQENIFTPLEMKDTHFHLPAAKHARLVSLYENQGSRLVKVNHPIYDGVDPLFPLVQGAYLSGGAGLVSTVNDYAKFLSLFMHKGRYQHKNIISPKTVELMLTNQLVPGLPVPGLPENFQFTLGGFALETDKNDYLQPLSKGSYGWGGAFNSHAWGDPQEALIGLLFTQEYLSLYWRIGEEFKVATYQALLPSAYSRSGK
ncbi:serine hydrolase domain-containing protein [Chitinophaga nivalis]|uniref:Beta-lactamase family protein n=1 Tax=Chitinophaga nivalis TaxID=2991709 RepID=A0ABT3IJA7_9BACT|nr:serine hydrolase domain-containing protein [Chitinophaga nivalis]MCW3466285.1 beta-lactamase family protein [Chitinophaga nivalis]MCW3484024.1 beta-lactamase family protein [Chitinophaga nivalis]